MFTIDFQGIPEMQRRLQALVTQANQALANAAQQEMERVLENSRPLVPL
jgi:hypothetical protein